MRFARYGARGARSVDLTVIACATLLAAMKPAVSAEEIELTALSGDPPVISWVKVFRAYFMPEVNRRLAETGNYRIAWKEGFSGTIVGPREELEGIETGLGDIGLIPTVFYADKVPFYNLSYVTPFVTTDLDLVVKAYDQLINKYEVVDNYWQRYNQVVLASAGLIENYVVITESPVQALKDFKGLKIGAAGTNLAWLEGIGVTGVNSNLRAYYNDIKNGVIDGAIVWAEVAGIFKMAEVAPHLLDAKLGAVASLAITVNADTWGRLPKEVRGVMQDVASEYRTVLVEEARSRAAAGLKTYVEMGGKVAKLEEAERRQWASRLPNLAKAWADRMKERGLPGEEILSDYMDIMRSNNQPIARHWDQ